jgi:hypothetical protein
VVLSLELILEVGNATVIWQICQSGGLDTGPLLPIVGEKSDFNNYPAKVPRGQNTAARIKSSQNEDDGENDWYCLS